jgi:hypothetical protein
VVSEMQQLKSILHRAAIPHEETAPNLTDNLVGLLVGSQYGGPYRIEFYFDLEGKLLNIETTKDGGLRGHGREEPR